MEMTETPFGESIMSEQKCPLCGKVMDASEKLFHNSCADYENFLANLPGAGSVDETSQRNDGSIAHVNEEDRAVHLGDVAYEATVRR